MENTSLVQVCLIESCSIPCNIVDGGSNTAALTSIIYSTGGPTVISRRYSSEVKIQLKPTEQWGSCHTEHDGGYNQAGGFSNDTF